MQRGGARYLLCYQSQYKNDDRKHTQFSFGASFLFHPLSHYKHQETYPVSYCGLQCSQREQSTWGGRNCIRWCITMALLARQWGTCKQVLQTTLPSLFFPLTLLFISFSLCKGGKHRAIFKTGFSQCRYRAVETQGSPKYSPSGMHWSKDEIWSFFLLLP